MSSVKGLYCFHIINTEHINIYTIVYHFVKPYTIATSVEERITAFKYTIPYRISLYLS